MTNEKKLAFAYLYIVECFHRLFNLIARFNITSAAEVMAKCNFSDVTNKSVASLMKSWSKDVKKFFKSYEVKSFVEDSYIELPDQFDKSIKDFSKRLDDFNNTEVNSYLENIQTEVQYHQNNKKILECLTLLKEALIRKQKYLNEFIKYMNDKYPEQSSVSESNLGDALC